MTSEDDFGLHAHGLHDLRLLVCRRAQCHRPQGGGEANCSSASSTLRNSFGLFSEDADFTTGELWGNFPQTYSMVGLINSAVRLSRSWEEAF